MTLDLVGPFEERVVVLDGWKVPLINAWEADGGTACITIDGRLAYTIPAGEAENVLWLVADVIANCWGYGAHPREDEPVSNEVIGGDDPLRQARFAHVPHPLLAPRRMHGIEAVAEEDTG